MKNTTFNRFNLAHLCSAFYLFFVSRFAVLDTKATNEKHAHRIDEVDGLIYSIWSLHKWHWVKRWGIKVSAHGFLNVRGTCYTLADKRTAYSWPRFHTNRGRIYFGCDFYHWTAFISIGTFDSVWLLTTWCPALRAYQLGRIVGQADFDLTAYNNDPMSEYAPGECSAPYSRARYRAADEYEQLPQTRLVRWAYDLGYAKWLKPIADNNDYWAQYEQDGPDPCDLARDYNDALDWAGQPTPYDP